MSEDQLAVTSVIVEEVFLKFFGIIDKYKENLDIVKEDTDNLQKSIDMREKNHESSLNEIDKLNDQNNALKNQLANLKSDIEQEVKLIEEGAKEKEDEHE
jgi:cell division protein FtsB